jgi:fatty acid desaturase
MLIQKILIAFRFLSLSGCSRFCAWPGCHLGALLCCFVVGSASTVALLTRRHEVVERVAATSVNLNQMISFGCLSFLAPVAPGFVGQDGTPVFVVLACLTWASVFRWH